VQCRQADSQPRIPHDRSVCAALVNYLLTEFIGPGRCVRESIIKISSARSRFINGSEGRALSQISAVSKLCRNAKFQSQNGLCFERKQVPRIDVRPCKT